MNFCTGHMVTEPAAQALVTARITAANLGDIPTQAVHDLGVLSLPDGADIRVYARHASDAVILDEYGQVVLITRAHDPGAGKLALPGGFIDDIDGAPETPVATAIREAHEETGIARSWLTNAVPIGHRAYDRPFDIRAAWNDPPGTSIKKGEWFGVSTQGFLFAIAEDLKNILLSAGDDARQAAVYRIDALKPYDFAVPDHLPMIHTAIAAGRITI